MTNEVNYAPIKYGCNGSTVKFSFNWKIIEPEDLVVLLEDELTLEQVKLVDGVDYTLEFGNVGGEITTLQKYPAGKDIIIAREVSRFQDKTYSTSSGFQTKQIEESLDRLSANVQDLNYALERAVKFPIGSEALNTNIEKPVPNNTLIWDEEGKSLVSYDIIGENARFQENVNEKINSFEIKLEGDLGFFEDKIEKEFENFKVETEAAIALNKAEIDERVGLFEDNVNSTIQDVRDAAEKINELEDAVEEANTSAAQASNALLEVEKIKNEVSKLDVDKLATKEDLLKKQNTLVAGDNISIKDDVISAAGGMPIGLIVAMDSNSVYVPDGYLPCDGAEYEKEQFPDFCNNYLTGNVESLIEGSWDNATSYYRSGWNAFAYANGVYVLVGGDGKVSTSTDGLTWTSPKAYGGTAHKTGVAYGNGVFVACSIDSGYFLISKNSTASSWDNTYTAKSSSWRSIAFGNGRFVSIAANGDIVMSETGANQTWTASNIPTINTAWESLSFGNGIFLAANTNGYVSTSTDGLVWSEPVLVHSAGLSCVAFDDVNNRFILPTKDALILSSTDGLSFNQIGNANGLTTLANRSFVLGNGKALAIDKATSTVYETTNYKKWTSTKIADLTNNNWVLGYGKDKFFAFNCNDNFCFFKTYYTDFLSLLNTCSYEEYEQELATYGQCAKFGLDGLNTIIQDASNTTASIDVGYSFVNLYPNGIELEFTYNGLNWLLDGKVVALSDYYITATGTPTAGDSFRVEYGLVQRFRVPLIKDGSVIQQALTDSELGKSYNAGLPNIRSSITVNSTATADTQFLADNTEIITSDGALYVENVKSCKGIGQSSSTTSMAPADLSFDASRSNAIYGNSDTVQMNAVALRYFVVVANGQTNQSMMDWSAWASSLQAKMNADHSNDTKPYIVETSDKSILPSWYRVWSDGWCEQGGIATGGTNITGNTITLLKVFINNQYNLLASVGKADITTLTNSKSLGVACFNKTTSSFNASTMYGDGTFEAYTFSWQAKGYIK